MITMEEICKPDRIRGKFNTMLGEVQGNPDRGAVIQLAALASEVSIDCFGCVTGGCKLLHVHHVKGDQLACLREVYKSNTEDLARIPQAVWQHLTDSGKRQDLALHSGVDMLEGSIDETAAEAITKIALEKMIPNLYSAYINDDVSLVTFSSTATVQGSGCVIDPCLKMVRWLFYQCVGEA
jgi:hypothetical protein